MKRPVLFIVNTSLWFLLVGPIVISIPWFFLYPAFLMLGALPALIAGIFLGVLYRSRPIPDKFFHRASDGACAGFLSISICFGVIGLLESQPLEDGFFLGVLGFAIIGAYSGSITFGLMPAKLRNFGMSSRTTGKKNCS